MTVDVSGDLPGSAATPRSTLQRYLRPASPPRSGASPQLPPMTATGEDYKPSDIQRLLREGGYVTLDTFQVCWHCAAPAATSPCAPVDGPHQFNVCPSPVLGPVATLQVCVRCRTAALGTKGGRGLQLARGTSGERDGPPRVCPRALWPAATRPDAPALTRVRDTSARLSLPASRRRWLPTPATSLPRRCAK